MKSAIGTRFRCRRPLIDLEQLTSMFLTLILQYLNKLVERKVRDLTSPQAFHTVKAQGFNSDCVELLTEFRGELPMKVFALVANPSVETCKLPYTSPPVIRTFLFSRKTFVERSKFVQGVSQGLWVLFLLTRAECQVCVFHTEVCPNALTCCRQKFGFYKVCEYVEPIITTSVTLDGDMTNVSIKLTVFMECIRDFIISPFTVIPFTKGKGDTIPSQRPTRLLKHKRFKFMTGFPFRLTPKFLEKSHIRCINTPQLLLDRLTRQRIPMRMCRSFQLGQVGRHSVIVRIRETLPIPCVLPPVKIVMHLPHIVKQVTQTDCIRLISELIFIRFHGLSSIKSLAPCTVGGTDTLPSGNAVHVGPT